MPLQTSGQISLSNIATEFGGTAPHALSEYYAADSGIPASGQVKLSNFYGAASGPNPLTINYNFSNYGAKNNNYALYGNPAQYDLPVTAPFFTGLGDITSVRACQEASNLSTYFYTCWNYYDVVDQIELVIGIPNGDYSSVAAPNGDGSAYDYVSAQNFAFSKIELNGVAADIRFGNYNTGQPGWVAITDSLQSPLKVIVIRLTTGNYPSAWSTLPSTTNNTVRLL